MELNGKKQEWMIYIFIFDICFDIRTMSMRVYIHKIEHFSYFYKLFFCLSGTFIEFIRCLLIISSYIQILCVYMKHMRHHSFGWVRSDHDRHIFICMVEWNRHFLMILISVKLVWLSECCFPLYILTIP